MAIVVHVFEDLSRLIKYIILLLLSTISVLIPTILLNSLPMLLLHIILHLHLQFVLDAVYDNCLIRGISQLLRLILDVFILFFYFLFNAFHV
jgi:hypothetical protein